MRDISEPVPNWQPPVAPDGKALIGKFVKLEPLGVEHATELFTCNKENDSIWDYLPYGPFATLANYEAWIGKIAGQPDPHFYAIRDLKTGKCSGVASYLRVQPDAGSIEVGHINFSASLQKTTAATEAMYLMMKWAFETGYRRYEWKCNAANLGSRRAAQRLGLSFEGVFRQAAVIKGRNRDTAWFAAIDKEWPKLRAAMEEWLAPESQTGGAPAISLSAKTESILAATDPALTA